MIRNADKSGLKRNRVKRARFDLLYHFYETHHREVMSYALFFTRDEEDAVDTLQDTFCMAMESLEAGVNVDNPRSWLIKIARNSMIRRKERRQLEQKCWQKHAEENPLTGNFTTRLLNGILADNISDYVASECTPGEQEVFVLRHYHEMNLADIAQVTGQALTNVHRILATVTDRVQTRFSGIAG